MSPDPKQDPVLRPRAAAALQRLKESRSRASALEVVGEIVSQLLGCEEYALLALSADGARFSLVSAVGLEPERLQGLLVPQGLLGQAARHGVHYIAGRTSAAGASVHEAGLTVCIPIRNGGRTGGVLAIFRMLPQRRGLNEEDLELLDILSAHGGAVFSEGGEAAPVLSPPPVSAPASVSTDLRTVYIDPGGLFATKYPTELMTILGSSVSVCLWDEHLRLGGMNHFLLPTAPAGQPASGRHGAAAIPMLLKELERLGSQRPHLRAKVFGGADMAGGSSPDTRALLGQQNADMARRLLAEAGIPIIAEELGGPSGRKLRFRTDDGTVLLKVLGEG
jgi:chemotaxis protein CheD